MYGYINVDKSLLAENEFSLFHTFLCGLCVSTKKIFGNLPRLTLSYDVNFFSILFHSFCGIQVEFENARCVLSPIKKRSILKTTELTDLVSAGSLLMLYVKLIDDAIDSKSFAKSGIRVALKPFIKKADKLMPSFSTALQDKYSELRSLEKSFCSSIDIACDPFATTSALFAREVLKEKSNAKIESLCYNIGKWVYLIDALDDLKEDIKAKRYNPLISCFGDNSRPLESEAFITDNSKALEFVFFAALNAIARDFNDLNLTMYRCLLTNILFHSLRQQTEKLLNSDKNE